MFPWTWFSSHSLSCSCCQVWPRGPRWQFLHWWRDSRARWPAPLRVSALDLILKSLGAGEETEERSLTSQLTRLRLSLPSQRDTAQLWHSMPQQRTTATVSSARSASGATWKQRKRQFSMFHVSAWPSLVVALKSQIKSTGYLNTTFYYLCFLDSGAVKHWFCQDLL